MRRNVGIALAAVVLFGSTVTAQFKDTSELRESVSGSLFRQPQSDLWLGWFDPSKLTMQHSFSLSYSSFGGHGLSIGMYTNSLTYRFSDPLEFRMDISLMHSPYNTFGTKSQSDLSGLFLNRAQLTYRPSDNTLFQIQYRQLPPYYWYGSGYRSWDPLYRFEEDRR